MVLLAQAVTPIAQALSDKPIGLTSAGWIFIAIAWTTIISIAVFCYRKVLQKAAERRQRELLASPSLGQSANEKVSS
jgi:hypothetical protein